MSELAPSRPIILPRVSYAPFRLLEAVPWLMFAAAMRTLSVRPFPISLAAAICSDVSIFFAFLLAARRMIEFNNGRTKLGSLSFAQQFELARNVLVPVILLMICVAAVVATVGPVRLGVNLLLGFDGIAFDQWISVGMVWSAILAAITLLMVTGADRTGTPDLFRALKELWDRSTCMVPAIVAVGLGDVALSVVQSSARIGVYLFWLHSPAPETLRNLVYFAFIFAFASVRLWMTLAILVFATHTSHRMSARAETEARTSAP